MLYSGHRSQLTHLAVVERLGEPDLGVILEQVRIALDALRDRGGGGVGHCSRVGPARGGGNLRRRTWHIRSA